MRMASTDQIFASIAILEQRGELLRKLRQFFYDHDFLEVETPLLASEVIPELHIEPISVHPDDRDRSQQQYLQTSPELHMKRLIAKGVKAIFQVTRSFRAGERGPLHHPEFTIVEWYRTGDDLQAGMNLLDELCQVTLATSAAKRTTYATAFKEHTGICPHTSTTDQLAARAKELELTVPDSLRAEDRDQWLNLLLALQVEPQLGSEGPEILYDYPVGQAALAKVVTREDGSPVAERFELYYQGVELANGYHELTDAVELRSRLEAVNQHRELEGRKKLPMPESLLGAMRTGLPDCAGCALGFDRLAMLSCQATELQQVQAF